MAYAVRDFSCADCGQQVAKRAPAGAEVRCITCSVARSAANALAQHQRRGEMYRRWAAGMRRAADRAEVLADLADEVDGIYRPR